MTRVRRQFHPATGELARTTDPHQRARDSVTTRALKRTASTIALAIAFTAIGAGCGRAGHAATTGRTSSSPTTTRAGASATPLRGPINLIFTDTATPTKCPPRTPAGEECFTLTASTTLPGHGTISLGPTLDIEAPSSSSQCGATTTFTTRLTTAQGVIDVNEHGPRLCLQALGTIKRDFQITGGSGPYVHATGTGTATIDVQTVGATESWAGQIKLKGG